MASSAIADLKDNRVPPSIYWSIEQVGQWIEELGFPQYKSCFTTNHISGRNLILITASQLPSMGVTDFEHIKKITKEIRKVLELEEPFWNKSISIPPRNIVGMYIEKKAIKGKQADILTYQQFLNTHENPLWQPPLNNHCQLLPQI